MKKGPPRESAAELLRGQDQKRARCREPIVRQARLEDFVAPVFEHVFDLLAELIAQGAIDKTMIEG